MIKELENARAKGIQLTEELIRTEIKGLEEANENLAKLFAKQKSAQAETESLRSEIEAFQDAN